MSKTNKCREIYNQTMDLIEKMEEEGYDIAMKYFSDICH